jgi:hypothetical protein
MLKAKMSYKKQGIEFMPNPIWGIVKLYKAEKGLFPWGFRMLVFDIMEKWLKYSGELYGFTWYHQQHDIEKWYDLELRDYQKNAVKALVDNNGQMICIPTGGGKTRVMIEYMKQLNCKTLVICPSLDLVTQWQKIKPDFCDVRTFQSIKDKKLLHQYGLIIMDECHMVAARTLYNIAMNCGDSIICGCSATI